MEEEEGLTCMVCQEGYTYKPDEVLGLYVFAKKVKNLNISSLEGATEERLAAEAHYPSDLLDLLPRSRASCSLCTSVSSFNVIHLSCHVNAAKADRALKTPKNEWEGAKLRNSRASCNSLLPLYTPGVNRMTFLGAVERHFGCLSSYGDHSISRFGQIMHDIRLLMLRISYQETLWDDAGG